MMAKPRKVKFNVNTACLVGKQCRELANVKGRILNFQDGFEKGSNFLSKVLGGS